MPSYWFDHGIQWYVFNIVLDLILKSSYAPNLRRWCDQTLRSKNIIADSRFSMKYFLSQNNTKLIGSKQQKVKHNKPLLIGISKTDCLEARNLLEFVNLNDLKSWKLLIYQQTLLKTVENWMIKSINKAFVDNVFHLLLFTILPNDI